MSVLCVDNCHIFLGSSSLCTCEAHRVAMLYGFPANYNPFAPPKATPPTAADLPEVPAQFKAAQAIKDATHLSADGQRVFAQRMGSVRVHYWDDETNGFGSSFPCPNGLPSDAVVLK